MSVQSGAGSAKGAAHRSLAPVLIAVALLLIVTLGILAVAFGRPGETRDLEPTAAPPLDSIRSVLVVVQRGKIGAYFTFPI